MAPRVNFAWNGVDRILSFDLSQNEGEAAALEVLVENPGFGLLAPGRERECELRVDEAGGNAGVVFFKGRVNGTPTDLAALSVKLEFLGQSENADADLRAYADTLRELPHYDPLFFSSAAKPDERDPAEVLEARSEKFHVSPVTHGHSISDVLEGDRVIDLGDRYDADSFKPRVTAATVSRAKLQVSCEWEQAARGGVDVSSAITPSYVQSLSSADGLMNGEVGDGSGWSVVSRVTETASQTWTRDFLSGRREVVSYRGFTDPALPILTKVRYETVRFMRQSYRFSSFVATYEYSQARREVATVKMAADVQPVLDDDSEEDLGELSLASLTEDRDTPVWEAGTDYARGDRVQWNGSCYECVLAHAAPSYFSAVPLDRKHLFVRKDGHGAIATADVLVQWVPVPKRSAVQGAVGYRYLDTERGMQSLTHAALRVRAFLRRRMRSLEVTFRGAWEDLSDVTTRDSVRIIHPIFAAGHATGKVVAYRKSWDGATQARYVEVTLGFPVGRDTLAQEFSAPAAYSAAFAPGYSRLPGAATTRTEAGVSFSVTADRVKRPVVVEKLSQSSYAVQSVEWRNLAPEQLALMAAAEAAGRPARAALEKAPTGYTLRFRSLASEDSLERRLEVECKPAVGPRGVDLGG